MKANSNKKINFNKVKISYINLLNKLECLI